MYTKFQRLKNSATKLARVLIIDETPSNSMLQSPSATTVGNQKTTRDTMQMSLTGSQDELNSSQRQAGTVMKTQGDKPQSLLYYPERLHSVKKEDCD